MAKHEIDRRSFFRSSSSMVAGAAAASATDAQAAVRGPDRHAGATVLPYGRRVIARAKQLVPGVPLSFHFPDDASPCVVIKNGRPVPGGVGPDRDIAAFSTLCPHMGCPTLYDGEARVFRCPCHFSLFDAELSGQTVCGQATVDLPEIVLEYDAASDALSAVAIRGLLYGRAANVL